MTIRKWLEADYGDILALINSVEEEWRRNGSGQRRNWWDVLAGNEDGSPLVIAGVEFPILRAARVRKGWEATSESICRNEHEVAPGFRFGRWRTRRLPKKVQRAAKKISVKRSRARAS
jgi:hypothetical protein